MSRLIRRLAATASGLATPANAPFICRVLYLTGRSVMGHARGFRGLNFLVYGIPAIVVSLFCAISESRADLVLADLASDYTTTGGVSGTSTSSSIGIGSTYAGAGTWNYYQDSDGSPGGLQLLTFRDPLPSPFGGSTGFQGNRVDSWATLPVVSNSRVLNEGIALAADELSLVPADGGNGTVVFGFTASIPLLNVSINARITDVLSNGTNSGVDWRIYSPTNSLLESGTVQATGTSPDIDTVSNLFVGDMDPGDQVLLYLGNFTSLDDEWTDMTYASMTIVGVPEPSACVLSIVGASALVLVMRSSSARRARRYRVRCG